MAPKASRCQMLLGFPALLSALVSMASFWLLLFSPVALWAVWMFLTSPYLETKHFSESTTSCTVTGVEQGIATCSCGKNMCYYTHSCWFVTVNFTDPDSGEIIVNATLYDNAKDYGRLKRAGARTGNYTKCSAYSCIEDKGEREKDLEQFELEYATVGKSFPCHPGSESEPEALITVIYQWEVLVGMLIPACILIVCFLAGIIGLIHKRKYKRQN